jgi:hypothetical protein
MFSVSHHAASRIIMNQVCVCTTPIAALGGRTGISGAAQSTAAGGAGAFYVFELDLSAAPACERYVQLHIVAPFAFHAFEFYGPGPSYPTQPLLP